MVEHLLKPIEAARLLNVSVQTLYTWANRRQIPVQKVRGALRFSPSALEGWLATQARPSRTKHTAADDVRGSRS
jgi:excisionase family DNA binding protein